MGEDRTEGHTDRPHPNAHRPTGPNAHRVTVSDAALALGITPEAVRMRIKRGTLAFERTGGRVYVLLGSDQTTDRPTEHTADQTSGASQTAADPRDELIAQLRMEVEGWREESRRKDHLLAAALERIPAIEAPSQEPPSEPPQAPTEATDEQQGRGPIPDASEHPQPRSGWRAPVDKLPSWHYVLGLSLVFVATYLALAVGQWLMNSIGQISLTNVGIVVVIMFAQAWVVPGVFACWVGLRRRNPRLVSQVIPFGALVGVVAVSGFLFYFYVYPGELRGTFFTDLEDNWVLGFFLLPEWLLYVSGVLIGNAWQRRRTGRVSGTTPASPFTGNRPASAQPREDWTPRKQALLGWSGTIISALLGLLGTIITVSSGG